MGSADRLVSSRWGCNLRSERARGRSLRIYVLGVVAIALLLASGAPRAEDHPDFLVVVNTANPVRSLTTEDVSRLFLKEVTAWASGQQVLPVDQSENSSVRAAFTRQVLRRKIAAVKAYWQQRIFSGRDLPPPVRTSDAEVIRYVEANPGAIGYLSNGTALGEKTKVLELLGTVR